VIQLTEAIPDVDVLLSLSTEELAAKILFLLRQRGQAMFFPPSLQNELWEGDISRGKHPYPIDRKPEVEPAVAEAAAARSATNRLTKEGARRGWRTDRPHWRLFVDKTGLTAVIATLRVPVDWQT
jgi:hypothetical protein